MIKLEIFPSQTDDGTPYQHLRFSFEDVLEPSDIKELPLPKIDFKQGVVIEGRGPIWLYAYLLHECHPAAWAATYDPRLGGVVVQTHSPGVRVGQVLPITLP